MQYYWLHLVLRNIETYEGVLIIKYDVREFNLSVYWPCRPGLQNKPTFLQRDKTSLQREVGYDTKNSDREAPVMLELWGMQSTPWLPSLPGPLWLGGVESDSVLSMDQIELFDILTVYFMLNWIVWNRTAFYSTVCKQMTDVWLNC